MAAHGSLEPAGDRPGRITDGRSVQSRSFGACLAEPCGRPASEWVDRGLALGNLSPRGGNHEQAGGGQFIFGNHVAGDGDPVPPFRQSQVVPEGDRRQDDSEIPGQVRPQRLHLPGQRRIIARDKAHKRPAKLDHDAILGQGVGLNGDSRRPLLG